MHKVRVNLRKPNVVLMLGHRLRRRPNIKTTLRQRIVVLLTPSYALPALHW